MAMRDPGTPGRNPFLDGPREDPGEARRDEASDRSEPPDLGTDALGTLAALVEALGDAQPEAAEHLVAAAHEVVLVVKTVVDAVELALGEQRAEMQAARDPSVRRIDLG